MSNFEYTGVCRTEFSCSCIRSVCLLDVWLLVLLTVTNWKGRILTAVTQNLLAYSVLLPQSSWSRFHLKNLTGIQLASKLLVFYRNRKFNTLYRSECYLNPVHSFTSGFFSSCFDRTFPLCQRFPSWICFLRILHYYSLQVSLASYVLLPPHLHWFDHPTVIWRTASMS